MYVALLLLLACSFFCIYRITPGTSIGKYKHLEFGKDEEGQTYWSRGFLWRYWARIAFLFSISFLVFGTACLAILG